MANPAAEAHARVLAAHPEAVVVERGRYHIKHRLADGPDGRQRFVLDSWLPPIAGGAPDTVNETVADGDDDAHERVDGESFSASMNYMYASALVDPNVSFIAGMRFASVAVPNAATIDVAYISIVPYSADYDDPRVYLHLEDGDNPVDFADNADVWSRSRTADPQSWIDTGLYVNATTYVNSPSIVDSVQTVVDRGGWATGQAMVVLARGYDDEDSDFIIKSFEHTDNVPAKLHIEYSVGGVTHEGEAAISGGGTLSVLGSVIRKAAATIAGAGVLTVAAVATLVGASAISGEGTLQVAAVRTVVGAASTTGEGTLSVHAGVTRVGAASLAGNGTLAVAGSIGELHEGAASIAGEGTFAVQAVLTRVATAVIAGEGTLSAAAGVKRAASAGLSTEGTVGEDLGNDSESTSRGNIPANFKAASKFTLSAAITIKVTEIKAYCRAVLNPCKVKALIYADNAGAPAGLLGTSQEVTGIDTTLEWRTFAFASPVSLSAGTYWLGLHIGDNNLYFYRDVGDEDQMVANGDAYADGPTDPFGADPGYLAYSFNIYAPLGVHAEVLDLAAVSMAGEGTLSAAGTYIRSGASSLASEGTLSIAAHFIRGGKASLAGEGTLLAGVVAALQGAASLSGEGTVTIAGWIIAAAVVPVGYAEVDVIPAAQAGADTLPAGSAKGQAPKHGFARIPPL